MNDRIALETYCRANWRDRTAWLALVDMVGEQPGVTIQQARRVVATIRRTDRLARELFEATAYLAKDSPHRNRFSHALLIPFVETHNLYATLIVKPGHARPHVVSSSRVLTSPLGDQQIIMVGAVYVLKVARLYKALLAFDEAHRYNVSSALTEY